MEPQRGDIWMVNLDPIEGHEQGGTRPALVISVNPFNESKAELIIILPITSKNKRIPTHIKMEPPEGGLPRVSYIKSEDIRSISKNRLRDHMGEVSEKVVHKAESMLRLLLGL